MAILQTGNTYVDNDQVTAATLNAAINSATFASGAADGATTQLSGGSLIVRDGGITPAKLSTGGPSWNSGGTLTATAFSGPLTGNVTGNVSGTAANVTGTVAIANGGTGATTAGNARTALGLGTAAVQNDDRYAHRANNLSDLANAGTARSNLGATTVGSNMFTLGNPSAIRFLRLNADNSVSALSDADFRTAIGAGAGGGSVTSVALSGGTTGLTVSGSPITTSGTITLAGTLAVANGGTGATSAGAARTALDVPSSAGSGASGTWGIAITGNAATATTAGNVTGTVAIANGGTGATNAGAALTALGAYPASNPSGFTSNAGTITGSTGSNDNRVLLADGGGGSTVKSSPLLVDGLGNVDGVDNLTASGIFNTSAGHYRVAGTQVVGAQAASEADVPATGSIFGFDAVDESTVFSAIVALENKVNNILAKLRTHGLIAT